MTGWNDGLCQDYDRKLGAWFANRPGARQQLRETFMPQGTPASSQIIWLEQRVQELENEKEGFIHAVMARDEAIKELSDALVADRAILAARTKKMEELAMNPSNV